MRIRVHSSAASAPLQGFPWPTDSDQRNYENDEATFLIEIEEVEDADEADRLDGGGPRA